MTISIQVEPEPGFIVCRYAGRAGGEDLRRLIVGYETGLYPADRNVLHDLSEAETLGFEARVVADLTMRRRATIPDSPAKPVCAAVFGVKPTMEDAVSLWTAFFQDDPAHHIQQLDTEAEARSWLERCAVSGC
jgi:hypothetical protein